MRRIGTRPGDDLGCVATSGRRRRHGNGQVAGGYRRRRRTERRPDRRTEVRGRREPLAAHVSPSRDRSQRRGRGVRPSAPFARAAAAIRSASERPPTRSHPRRVRVRQAARRSGTLPSTRPRPVSRARHATPRAPRTSVSRRRSSSPSPVPGSVQRRSRPTFGPWEPMNTLAGLRSPWTTPDACARSRRPVLRT